ncbi:hypothetical protein Cni_G02218 [Canna indica]|uniref:Glabrous enhancer-binding protein-like DBD domain-containing protein n=1 Tax=Canna indica TaxID=4628 RepID=A0AAQ3Q1Z3_9LILI|nr:hypothetical protein Cni_G02218 [Canna indica]
MAPKRAAEPESSGSSYTSSSDEDGSREADEVSHPSVYPKKQPPQNKLSHKPPAAAAASDDDDDNDEEDDGKGDESSGDEDGDTEESSSDEESESEDEKGTNLPPPPQPKQKTPQPPSKPQQPPPKSTPASSDSGTGSSDDSDSGTDSSDEAPVLVSAPRPSRAVDPSIKPINSMPMDVSLKPDKHAASPPPPPRPSHSLKRKQEAPVRDNNHGGKKRQLFQRLWSLESEIALLNGLVECRNKKGVLPVTANEMEDFREFIRGSLQMEFTNSQLANKLRGLKKKFLTNVARRKNGADPTFSNSHDQDAFELSKKVWGVKKSTSKNNDDCDQSDGSEESPKNMRVLTRRDDTIIGEQSDPLVASRHDNTIDNETSGTAKYKSQYPFLWDMLDKMSDEPICGIAVKKAMNMLTDADAKQMEEKIKKLRQTELRQHLRRIDLSKESVKFFLDALSR